VYRYAATLLEAAVESGALAHVQQDAERLLATVRQSPDLSAFLRNSLLRAQVQSRALEELFAGKVQELTLRFLLLVAQRRRAGLLPEMLEAFLERAEERAGIVRVEVRSAVELSERQADQLRERLMAYTGRQVRLRTRVDGSLRGGLVAKVGDTVFDGSLATQLERLRRRLVGT
jgi:F-type H+-transporting ATPase subunit delta